MANHTITRIDAGQVPTFTSDITIHTLQDIELDSPILIEGLPGVGHVGKLVADLLIDELDAERIADIYSIHLPPQVVALEDSTVRMVRNELYAHRAKNGNDLLILAGDYQSATNEGHYILCDAFLDIAQQFGVSRIYTLGGYATYQLEDADSVVGVVNNADMIEELSGYGVEFQENEPCGGIVGVSGLMLAMGEARNIDAACLMGITSGYLVDPKSAQAVLRVLSQALGIEVDTQSLDEHAAEMENVVAKLQEMQQMQESMSRGDEDLRYIG